MRRLAAALACLALTPLFAQTGPPRPADELPQRMDRERSNVPGAKSDWEREQEARNPDAGVEVALPAPPPREGLIEFFVSSASSFRFYIDPNSLSVGNDGVVRYTLLARSPSGAESISYEGIRCGGQGLVRVYAFANGGKWTRNAGAEWREIQPRTVQRWHSALRSQYFCPTRYSIQSAAEGLNALRRGGHPAVANTGH